MEKISSMDQLLADPKRRYRVVFRHQGQQAPYAEADGYVKTAPFQINYDGHFFHYHDWVFSFNVMNSNGLPLVMPEGASHVLFPDRTKDVWAIKFFNFDGKEGEGNEIFLLP